MKRLASFLTVSLIIILGVTSCKEVEDPVPQPINNSAVKIVFGLYNGNDSIHWDDVIAVDNVNEYRMEFFKFYLSNFKIEKSNGNDVFLKDVVIANAVDTGGMIFSFAAPEGSYEKLMIGIGLDSLLNASDPVSFPDEHPLSSAQSMYWSWATKYRFTRVDGKANENGTLGDGNDLLIAHHPGADEFYKIKEFVKPFTLVKGDTTQITIKMDVAKWFDGPGGIIDLPTEPQTHTAPSDYHIAVKYTENFFAALELM